MNTSPPKAASEHANIDAVIKRVGLGRTDGYEHIPYLCEAMKHPLYTVRGVRGKCVPQVVIDQLLTFRNEGQEKGLSGQMLRKHVYACIRSYGVAEQPVLSVDQLAQLRAELKAELLAELRAELPAARVKINRGGRR